MSMGLDNVQEFTPHKAIKILVVEDNSHNIQGFV